MEKALLLNCFCPEICSTHYRVLPGQCELMETGRQRGGVGKILCHQPSTCYTYSEILSRVRVLLIKERQKGCGPHWLKQSLLAFSVFYCLSLFRLSILQKDEVAE